MIFCTYIFVGLNIKATALHAFKLVVNSLQLIFKLTALKKLFVFDYFKDCFFVSDKKF